MGKIVRNPDNNPVFIKGYINYEQLSASSPGYGHEDF